MAKITRKILKKLDTQFKAKRHVTIYMLLSLVVISVLLSSVVFYFIGHTDGYGQKTSEINAQEKMQQQQDLMSMELEQVRNTFLKYLMVKTMFWLPWIIGGIILGWILHGIF
jgi:Na+/H+ antiporter NhaB